MASSLQSRDKRALLMLGGALALFAVLQLDFFRPGATPAAASDSLTGLEQRLQTAQVRARQRPLTEAELAAARRNLAGLEERLLSSSNAALAQAEMRSLIGDLLTQQGIPLGSSRFGQAQLEGESYAQTPIVVTFVCGIDQLVNLMTEIANAKPLLTTRSIRVQPDKPEVKSIRVQMTVAGYLPVERTPELEKKTARPAAGGGL